MTDAKRWFELECSRCRGRFVEMIDLLFHRCPGQSDARNRRQGNAKRPTKGKARTEAQRLLQPAEGAQ